MAYTDPSYLTSLTFGRHSHWIQPWRGYLETMPASTFIDDTGMNFNISDGTNPDLVMHMLAVHGVRRVRIEESWGDLEYADETQLHSAARLQAILVAAKKYGVRPLILLNAHQGVPCPTQFVIRTLPNGAPAGATTVHVDDASGLQVGYSGLSNLTAYWAAEDLITDISGNTLTLSKPLPNAIAAGAGVLIATLKYRPFSAPGSADYNATMAGWARYVGAVARFVTTTLGTSTSADKGFDLEIWNELTFGSNFLHINNYYADNPYVYDQSSIYRHDLVQATVGYIDAHAAEFSGVQVGDGFANTIPWPASSTEPARIDALAKHPYAGRRTYPADDQHNAQGSLIGLNALGQPDSSYIPSYAALLPEYFGNALQTETMIRDMAPITTDIYGTLHGRHARTINGQVAPVTTWITEVNEGPNEDNPGITAAEALALKAKTTARYLAFYLNKGVTQLDFYGADGGDTGVGMVQDNFLSYARQPGATYPADDTPYTSPALAVMGRMVNVMQEGLDPSLTLATTRPLTVTGVSDTHNHYQFAGDGTAAHPPLYNRDVLAILPFQVNAHKFVIPYYVMTRDVTKPLAPEQFTVQLQGVQGTGATVTAYDPINNTSIPVTVTNADANSLGVTVTAADYPYLLTIQEAASPVASAARAMDTPTTATPQATDTATPVPPTVTPTETATTMPQPTDDLRRARRYGHGRGGLALSWYSRVPHPLDPGHVVGQ